MRLKPRQREGLAFALGLLGAAVVFTAWPGIDLAAARWFYADGRFLGNDWFWCRAVYRGFPWFGAALLVGAAITLARSQSRTRPPAPARRRAAMLLLVAALGVGAAVHMGLKDHWGRPRPSQVTAFGGTLPFQPALRISSECTSNCSFVSGHAAGGFALLAFDALAAARRRRRWMWVGLATGTVVGLGRMAQGSHFASDIVFALLVVWGVTLVLREAWLVAAAWRRRAARQRRARQAENRPA